MSCGEVADKARNAALVGPIDASEDGLLQLAREFVGRAPRPSRSKAAPVASEVRRSYAALATASSAWRTAGVALQS
jgi:hypothetical protein